MREILFRGKRTDNGEWVYGDVRHDYDGVPDCISDYCGSNPVVPETVGQYTGLTDKNGKKIFEGDIVKHYCFGDNLDEYDIGRIFWNGATCMFLRTCKSSNTYPQIWDSCEYEVIGNIHDNHELLKGGEG